MTYLLGFLALTGCGGSGSQAIDQLLGQHTSALPILTSVPNQTIAEEDLLKVDINNIKDGVPGNDAGMSYTCYYDMQVDGLVDATQDCTTIPNSTVSFDKATGILLWTPHSNTLGTYEIKINGTNEDGTFSQVFTVGVRIKFTGLGQYTQITGNSVTVNWTPNTDAQGYQVFKLNSITGQYELFKTIMGGANSGTTLTGLTPNTGYTLRVEALDSLGNPDGNVVSRSFTTTELVKLGMTASVTSATAGSMVHITIQAYNANDSLQTVGGLPITASISSGTASGNFSSVIDNNDGTYAFTFTPTTVGTPVTFDLTTNITFFLENTVTLAVTAGTSSSAHSTLAIGSSTLTSGNNTTLTATLHDAYDNPITTGVVSFAKTGGTSTGTFGSINNQGNGVYTVSYNGVTAGTAQTLSVAVDGVALNSTVTVQVTPGAPFSGNSTLAVTTNSLPSGSDATITATLKDINQNPILSGVLVSFAKSGGTSSGSFGSVINSGNGAYVTTYTGVTAGTAQTISVSVDGVTLIPVVSIAVIPGAPLLANSSFVVSSPTVVAGNFVTVTATLKDSNSNPIDSGVTVAFSKTGGTSTGTFGTVTNQGAGVYNIRYTAVKSGTAQNLTLQVAGADFGPTLQVTVLNGSPSPTHSTLALSAGSVVSGQSVTVTATLKDDSDNLISSGAAVSFGKSGGTSTGTFGTVTNAGNGVYTTTYTGLAAGSAQTISLLVDNSALGPSQTLGVTLGTPDATTSTLNLSANTVTAGQSVTLTATIKDLNGNAISSGLTLAFSTTGGTSTGTLSAVTNQGSGVYTATYTGNVAGTAQAVQIILGGTGFGTAQSLQVLVGAPALANSSLTSTSNSILSGGSSTFTATIRDSQNNPITTGVAITFSKSGGTSTGTFGTVTNVGAGVYTVTYTGVAAGTAQTIKVLTDGSDLGLSSSITVGVGAASQANSSLSLSSGSVISGQSVTVTATLKDLNNNPVASGSVISFTKTGGTSTGTFGSIVNQGAGVYTVTYTGVVSGTAQTIKVLADGTDLGFTPTVQVTPGAPSATTSTLAVSSATVISGSSVTVTATVKDSNSNPITSGVAITFAKTGGTSSGTFGSIVNTGGGIYTTTYSGVTAGSAQTINVLADGFNLGPSTSIQVTPGAPSSVLSTLTISSNTVIAGQYVTLTATVKDTNNNPISSGILVTFDKMSGSSFGNYGTVVNQGSGIYTVTYTGVTAGTAQTVQADVNGAGFGPTQSVQVLVGAPSAANSTLTLGAATVLSGASISVTALIRDSQNNPITNQNTMTFDAIGGSSTGSFGAISNNGAGTFSTTYTGSIAGSAQTVRVLADGTPITGLTAAITVVPGAVSSTNSTFTIASSAVQAGTSSNLSINLRDATNNAISSGSTSVTFTKSAGVSDGTIGTVTNSGSGNYSASYTGTTMGTAQAIALVVNGVSTGMTLNVTVTAGPPTHFGVTTPGGTLASIDCNGPYTLTLKDANENVTTSTTAVSLALASNPANSHTGTLFTDPACSMAASSFSIPASMPTLQFYYKSYVPKNFTLGITPSGGISTTNIVITNAAVLSWIGSSSYFTMNGGGSMTVQDDTGGGSMTPYDVAINGNYMFAADPGSNRITKYDIVNNQFIGWIGHVGSNENIAAFDGSAACSGLSVTNADLTPKWCVGGRSNPITSAILNAPRNIAVDSVYIYVSAGHRILRFLQSDGSYQGWIGKISTVTTSPSSCVSAGTGVTTPTWCFGGSVTSGTGDGQFSSPEGLAVYNGYLYVTDYGNQRIQRIDISGTNAAPAGWVGLVGATAPTSSGQLGTCSSLPATAAATPGWCKGGIAQASKRDANDIAGPSPGPEVAAPAEGFYNPSAVTTDGTYLYVTDNANYRVVRLNLSTGAFSGWIGYIFRNSTVSPVTPTQSSSTYTNGWVQGGVTYYTAGVSGFGNLNGITVDTSGSTSYLYVTDGYHRVMRLRASDGQDFRWIGRVATSPTGGYSGCSSTPVSGVSPGWCVGGAANKLGNTNGAFYNPVGMAFTTDKLFVADNSNFRIQRFNKVDGTFDGWIGGGNIQSTKWSRTIASGAIPSRSGIDDYSLGDTTNYNGLTMNGSYLFETDATFQRVKKFNTTDGSVVGYIGQISAFPPTGPDACVGYTSGMTPTWCTGGGRTTNGGGIQAYYNPFSVAADGTYLYVGSYSNHRIDRVRISDGLYMGWLGKISTVPTDGDSGCLTANTGDSTPGWCIGGTATSGTVNGNYNAPRALSYDSTGYLYVVDATSRLLKIKTLDGSVAAVAGYLSTGSGCTISNNTANGWCTSGTGGATGVNNYGGINAGNGITNNTNYIYVIDSGNHRLLRFDKTTGAPAGFIGKMSASTNLNTVATTFAVNGTVTTNGCYGLSGYPKATPGWCFATSVGLSLTTTTGTDSNAFNTPRGVWADDTNIYVADSANSRIVKIDAVTGNFIGWKGYITSTTGMTDATCIAAGVGGITPTWCAGGTSGPAKQLGAFDNPSGLYGDSNYIYVIDNHNNRTVTVPKN